MSDNVVARFLGGSPVAVALRLIVVSFVVGFLLDAFGLDSDTKRAVRLVFQPVLVAWALASTDAVRVLRERRAAAG